MMSSLPVNQSPIVLYAEPLWDSPYVFTVLVALHEKGLPVEIREVDLARGAQHDAGYSKRSLTARVPCIEHEGFALSESLAIIEYLDECFPAPSFPTLLPQAMLDRARARQLLGWLRSDLLPLREDRPTTSMFFQRLSTPLSERGRNAANKLLRVAEEVIPQGEGELFGAWSSVDADLAFMLHRLLLNGDEVPPRITRYARRQWSRASVQSYVSHPRPKHPT